MVHIICSPIFVRNPSLKTHLNGLALRLARICHVFTSLQQLLRFSSATRQSKASILSRDHIECTTSHMARLMAKRGFYAEQQYYTMTYETCIQRPYRHLLAEFHLRFAVHYLCSESIFNLHAFHYLCCFSIRWNFRYDWMAATAVNTKMFKCHQDEHYNMRTCLIPSKWHCQQQSIYPNKLQLPGRNRQTTIKHKTHPRKGTAHKASFQTTIWGNRTHRGT